MGADLDKTDHREECNQIPEPAHKDGRATLPEVEGSARHKSESHAAEHDPEERDRDLVGVVDSKMDGKGSLLEVPRQGNEGVFQPGHDVQLVRHCAPQGLRPEADEA